jgi:hypothetical protein
MIYTIVLSFVLRAKSPDPVLLVAKKCSFVAISVGVYILAFSCAFSIDIVSAILVAVWVDCMPLASVVSRGVAGFSVSVGELIRSAAFFFCHEVSLL